MSSDIIQVIVHPNPEIKSFLFHEPISAPWLEIYKKPLDSATEERISRLGAIGGQIVRDLLEIDGLNWIRINPKEIMLKKELRADWTQIEPAILEILHRALRKKRIHVINTRR
jgi:hypothetical protein